MPISETRATLRAGAAYLFSDPGGAGSTLWDAGTTGLGESLDTMGRGWNMLTSDFVGALCVLGNDPRGLGNIFGGVVVEIALGGSALRAARGERQAGRLSSVMDEVTTGGITYRRTSVSYEAIAEGGEFFAEGRLNNGTLSLNFQTQINGQRYPGLRGGEQFNAIINHFGRQNIQRINATWTSGDNLSQFNYLRSIGLSEVEAAEGTWTGLQARQAGFTKVTAIYTYPATPGRARAVSVMFE
ncbi:hypothetical protein HC928_08380 [bacterium]|nr:hypothetical protein [bacterium]